MDYLNGKSVEYNYYWNVYASTQHFGKKIKVKKWEENGDHFETYQSIEDNGEIRTYCSYRNGFPYGTKLVYDMTTGKLSSIIEYNQKYDSPAVLSEFKLKNQNRRTIQLFP